MMNIQCTCILVISSTWSMSENSVTTTSVIRNVIFVNSRSEISSPFKTPSHNATASNSQVNDDRGKYMYIPLCMLRVLLLLTLMLMLMILSAQISGVNISGFIPSVSPFYQRCFYFHFMDWYFKHVAMTRMLLTIYLMTPCSYSFK